VVGVADLGGEGAEQVAGAGDGIGASPIVGEVGGDVGGGRRQFGGGVVEGHGLGCAGVHGAGSSGRVGGRANGYGE
jgi:hypothetical protein